MNYLEKLASHEWEIESWTQEMDKPVESSVVAFVWCRELGKRITARITDLELRESEYWDREWQEMRKIWEPVVSTGMRVEPVVRKQESGDERGLIGYRVVFRPLIPRLTEEEMSEARAETWKHWDPKLIPKTLSE